MPWLHVCVCVCVCVCVQHSRRAQGARRKTCKPAVAPAVARDPRNVAQECMWPRTQACTAPEARDSPAAAGGRSWRASLRLWNRHRGRSWRGGVALAGLAKLGLGPLPLTRTLILTRIGVDEA